VRSINSKLTAESGQPSSCKSLVTIVLTEHLLTRMRQQTLAVLVQRLIQALGRGRSFVSIVRFTACNDQYILLDFVNKAVFLGNMA